MHKGFIYRAMMFAFRIRAFFFAGLVLSTLILALVRVGNDFDVRSGPGRLSFVLSPKGSRTGPDSSDYLRNYTRSLSSSVVPLRWLDSNQRPRAYEAPALPLRHTAENRIAEPQQVVARSCIVSLQFPFREFSTVYAVGQGHRGRAPDHNRLWPSAGKDDCNHLLFGFSNLAGTIVRGNGDYVNCGFSTTLGQNSLICGAFEHLVISRCACVGDSGNRNPAFRIAQWRRAVLRFGPEVLPRPWHPVEGSPLFVSPFRRWPGDRLSNFPAHGGTVARRYQERKGQTLSDLRSANV
jgi:hypothetical protein